MENNTPTILNLTPTETNMATARKEPVLCGISIYDKDGLTIEWPATINSYEIFESYEKTTLKLDITTRYMGVEKMIDRIAFAVFDLTSVPQKVLIEFTGQVKWVGSSYKAKLDSDLNYVITFEFLEEPKNEYDPTEAITD